MRYKGVAALIALGVLLTVLHVPGKVVAQVRSEIASRQVSSEGSSVPSGSGEVVLRPPNANGRLVVYVHGAGQSAQTVTSDPDRAPVTIALLHAGYTVAAADAGGDAWGNAESVAAYRGLVDSVPAPLRREGVYLLGESMGGVATVRLADSLPDVRAWAAWYPVCDLTSMLPSRYGDTIRAMHPEGVTGPERVTSTAPVALWASTSDTVVPKATNADQCAAAARAAGAAVTVHETSGEHGDPSNFDGAELVRFFDAA